MRIPAAFEPLNIDAPGRLIHCCGREQRDTTYTGNPSCLSGQSPGKSGSRQCGYSCIQNHCSWRVNVVQNWNREHATSRRTGKIGGVQRARMQRKSSKGDTDNHPAKNEWNRNKSERQSSPGEFAFRIGRNIQLHTEANGAGQSEKQSGIGKSAVRVALLHYFDQDRAGSQAEHGE